MPRPEKEQRVSDFVDKIRRATVFVLTRYSGLTALQMGELRRQLKQSGFDFHVVKNTLFERALQQAGLDGKVSELLEGPVAVAFGYGEPVELPKTLLKVTQDMEAFAVQGGIVEGVFLDARGIQEVSKLPAKPEMMGRVCLALLSPLYGLNSLVQITLWQLMDTIRQVGEKVGQEKAGGREMSAKVDELLEGIKSLTLLEAKQLVDRLQSEFGITAAAPVAVAPVAGAAATVAETAAPVVEEQTEFTVILQSAGEKKLEVIKTVRQIVPGLGLKEAKELVESAPKPVKENVTKEEAQSIKEKLEAVGATVEVK